MKIHVERETAYIIVHAQYCVLTYTKYTCGAGARLMAFSCFVKANVILVLYFLYSNRFKQIFSLSHDIMFITYINT